MTDFCFCSQHDLSKYPGGILREPFIHRRDVCGDPAAIVSLVDAYALCWYREVLMLKLRPPVREGEALVGRTYRADA